MTKMQKLSATKLRLIDSLVSHYEENIDTFSGLIYQLNGLIESSKELKALIHSVKARVKDPDHLRQKLIRNALRAKLNREEFPYSKANLFRKINDLAGFRILHLHTRQLEDINNALLKIFNEQLWILLEGPAARTWDDESKQFFLDIGFKTVDSQSMYTSVHYVVQPNSRSERTCEIQVRTLMEEVWGEVDHKINYPVRSKNESCREQIKVLARVTSSCSRLVDSIFLTHNQQNKDSEASAASGRPKRKKRNVG